MQSIITTRAKERTLETQKAEQAQQLAEAWIDAESERQVDALTHVPVSSGESSPTLIRLRSALGSTRRD